MPPSGHGNTGRASACYRFQSGCHNFSFNAYCRQQRLEGVGANTSPALAATIVFFLAPVYVPTQGFDLFYSHKDFKSPRRVPPLVVGSFCHLTLTSLGRSNPWPATEREVGARAGPVLPRDASSSPVKTEVDIRCPAGSQRPGGIGETNHHGIVLSYWQLLIVLRVLLSFSWRVGGWCRDGFRLKEYNSPDFTLLCVSFVDRDGSFSFFSVPGRDLS